LPIFVTTLLTLLTILFIFLPLKIETTFILQISLINHFSKDS